MVSKTNGNVMQSDITPTVSIVTGQISPLIISSPSEDVIVESSTLLVKGSAQKDALVVIQSPGMRSFSKTKIHNSLRKLLLFRGKYH